MSRSVLLVLLTLTLAGCNLTPSATPTATASATAAPLEQQTSVPLASASVTAPVGISIEGNRLVRTDPAGKRLWSVDLAPEPKRQFAVLGETVVLWGPHNNLRRFDVTTGKETDLTLAAGEVSVFGVYDDLLVQSTVNGLVGLSEKANTWHRMGLFTDSMVVGAGPSDHPVVLFVQRQDGLAKAVNLKDGKDSAYPLPKGAFTSVAIDRAAGVVSWVPKVGGAALRMKAEDGTPAAEG